MLKNLVSSSDTWSIPGSETPVQVSTTTRSVTPTKSCQALCPNHKKVSQSQNLRLRQQPKAFLGWKHARLSALLTKRPSDHYNSATNLLCSSAKEIIMLGSVYRVRISSTSTTHTTKPAGSHRSCYAARINEPKKRNKWIPASGKGPQCSLHDKSQGPS